MLLNSRGAATAGPREDWLWMQERGALGEAQSPYKTTQLAQLHPLGNGEWGSEPPSFPGPHLQHLPILLQIQESEHIKVENSESGSKLTILAARQEHCGCYTLLVENKLGSRQAQVNLTVVGESEDGWPGSQGKEGRQPPDRMVDHRILSLGRPTPSAPIVSAHSLQFSYFISLFLLSCCYRASCSLRTSSPADTHTHSVFLFLGIPSWLLFLSTLWRP